MRPLHVIRDDQVEFAVAIIIDPGGAGREFVRSPQSRGLGHIGEGAVAVVVEEMALAERGDEEVVEAVVIVIADGNSQAEHGNGEPGFASDIGESAVVIVVVELQRGCGALACPGQSCPLTSRMSGQPSLS